MVVRRLVVSLSLAVAGVVLPVATSYAADPSDLYVATVANGGDDTHQCVEAEPCATMARAIELAGDSGTTIHVGAGTFDGQVRPGDKSVAVDGSSSDGTVLTWAPDSEGYDGSVVGITAGSTSLSHLTVTGGQVADVFLVNQAGLHADDVVLTDGGCPLWVKDGAADVTDSVLENSGQFACGTPPTLPGSADVYLESGSATLTRSRVLNPAENTPAIAVFGGTFSADHTFVDNTANQSELNNSNGLVVMGGSAGVSRSTFHAFGTGVFTQGGTVSLSDSTFDDNVVGLTSSSGSATVVRSTFQGELASLQQEDTGAISVAGSVLGTDDIVNCAGIITDLGYNLATDDSCPFTGTSANEVAGLNLDSGLADRGGPPGLETVAILWPSSAVDTIPAGATYGDSDAPLCPASGSTDLRGVPRPVGGACDAGSMEMAQTLTAIDAPKTVKPHTTLELDVEVSVPLIDLGLDVPHGTVTVRSSGDVVCQDLPVADFQATCDVPDVKAGKRKFSATFTPAAGNTIHPSTSEPVTVLAGTRPHVKAPDKVTIQVGERVRIKLRASGEPLPVLRKIGGHLPRGLRFERGRGKATITGKAKPSSVGRHHIWVKATNLVGQDRHRLTLVVKRR